MHHSMHRMNDAVLTRFRSESETRATFSNYLHDEHMHILVHFQLVCLVTRKSNGTLTLQNSARKMVIFMASQTRKEKW